MFSNIMNHVLEFFSVADERSRTVLVHADTEKEKIQTRETNILPLIIRRPAK